MTSQATSKVRVTRYGAGVFECSGLTLAENETLQGAFNAGTSWVRVKDGRLESAPATKPPPAPYEDKPIAEHWNPKVQLHFGPLRDLGEPGLAHHPYPSITIQHVGAGSGWYDDSARTLESYGFECLRSRRGRDGRFWEIWYLPSLALAEGELARVVDRSAPTEQQVRAVVGHLCKSVRFGTLDVTVQRACLVYD